jgi:hypothetical protein
MTAGIPRPCVSTTRPLILPEVSWAKRLPADPKINHAATKRIKRLIELLVRGNRAERLPPPTLSTH